MSDQETQADTIIEETPAAPEPAPEPASTDPTEVLYKRLRAAEEKADRFARQRDEAKAANEALRGEVRKERIGYRLQLAGIDPDLVPLLAEKAPADEELDTYIGKWATKFAKSPQIVSPPRPGNQPGTPPLNPVDDLMRSLDAAAKR